MKRIKSIQIKAAIMLFVFSLNTIIGVACVCGIGSNNNSHHNDGIAVPGNPHEGCKKNTPEKVANGDAESGKENQKSKENKENCCADQVIAFNKADKSSAHSFNASINPAFFTVFVTAFCTINVLYTSYINDNFNYFVRSYHPPIPDIRLAIQSFQI